MLAQAQRMAAKLQVLPYAKALVKLHKKPLQMRFLACSGDNGLKPVALWLTSLFKAINVDLVREWRFQLRRCGVSWWMDDPFYITRSAKIPEAQGAFHGTRFTEEKCVASGGWQGWDFARLYTNIPQQDLTDKLHWILRPLVWGKHTADTQ